MPPPASTRADPGLVFAPVGEAQRRRRGSDGLRLAGAAAGLLCCLLIIHAGYRGDRVVAGVVSPPPSGISWLVTAAARMDGRTLGSWPDMGGPLRPEMTAG